MFSFDADSVIQFLVDAHIDRRSHASGPNKDMAYSSKGIRIQFRVSVNDWNSEERKESIKFVTMIFFGNVSVFYKVSDRPLFFNDANKDPESYVNSSNHDSCWRTDGFNFLSKLYFEMCKEVNPDVAPITLTSTDFASQIRISPVRVYWKYEKGDYGYFRKIVKINNIKEDENEN